MFSREAMTRSPRLCLLAALALVAGAASASDWAPPQIETSELRPLSIADAGPPFWPVGPAGRTWTYYRFPATDGGEPGHLGRRILSLTEEGALKDGSRVARIREALVQQDGEPSLIELAVRATDQAVDLEQELGGTGLRRVEPAVPIVRFPLSAGRAWTSPWGVGGTVEVVGQADVTIGDRQYPGAIVLETQSREETAEGTQALVRREYLAAGVGLILRTRSDSGAEFRPELALQGMSEAAKPTPPPAFVPPTPVRVSALKPVIGFEPRNASPYLSFGEPRTRFFLVPVEGGEIEARSALLRPKPEDLPEGADPERFLLFRRFVGPPGRFLEAGRALRGELWARSPDGIRIVSKGHWMEGREPEPVEGEPLILKQPIEQGGTWTSRAGAAPWQYVGQADVTLRAGTFPGCLVRENVFEARVGQAPSGVRRKRVFQAPALGDILTLGQGAFGEWQVLEELKGYSPRDPADQVQEEWSRVVPRVSDLAPLPGGFEVGPEWLGLDIVGLEGRYLGSGPGREIWTKVLEAGPKLLGRYADFGRVLVREIHLVTAEARVRIRGDVITVGPDGVRIVAHVLDRGKGEEPRIEPIGSVLRLWPRVVRADATWRSSNEENRAIGIASVATPYGIFEGCLVVESTTPEEESPRIRRTRRYYVRGPGLVFEHAELANGRWLPITDLKWVGAPGLGGEQSDREDL